MSPRQTAIGLIALGLAIPSIFLAIALPGGDNYTDAGGLGALAPWLIIVAPTSLGLLARGIYKLIKELKI
jgi:hypothetical protein